MGELHSVEQALAAVIQARRQQRRLTQAEAVELLEDKVTDRTLSNQESGRQRLTIPRLLDLAQAYGVSAGEMLLEAEREAERDGPCRSCGRD